MGGVEPGVRGDEVGDEVDGSDGLKAAMMLWSSSRLSGGLGRSGRAEDTVMLSISSSSNGVLGRPSD